MTSMVFCIALVFALNGNNPTDDTLRSLPVLSAALQVDTLRLTADVTTVLVVIADPFCSTCLTELDSHLDMLEQEGVRYHVVMIGSDHRAYAQRRLADLRRLVKDVRRVCFTTARQISAITASALDRTPRSPFVILHRQGSLSYISYDVLFPTSPGKPTAFNASGLDILLSKAPRR